LRALKEFADFFLPRFCFGCSKKLDSKQALLCDICRASLKRADDKLIHLEYERKFAADNIIDDLIAVLIFEKDKPIQSLFHHLKYNHRFVICKIFNEFIVDQQLVSIRNWGADYMTSIPLHSSKRIERGFNQADYICRRLSRLTGVPLAKNLLKRTKKTESQTKLSIVERKANILNVFKVRRPSLVKGKNFILVDDIITTGATINEAGRILKLAGAKRLYALAAAIAE